MSLFEGSKNLVIFGGNYAAQRVESTLRGFDLLASKALPWAFHQAGADPSHSVCHPNTRTRILQQIKDWAYRKTRSGPFIMWLNGAAGGGKTAIGRTIADWCEKEGILLGEFFFSRGQAEQDQMDRLPATLAYRMATLTLQTAKEAIIRAVTHDPLIFSTSLKNQMTKLVLEPLNNETPCGIIPNVIILDGLDECLSAEEQDLVLDALSDTLHSLNPDLRILICSRPEPTIATAFNAPRLREISTRISLSDDIDSDADIRIFLVERFAVLRQQLLRPPSGEWPTAADITHLVQKSSGQFIFASTVVKYVCSSAHRHKAVTRLKHVLNLKKLPSKAPHPFADLDALYSLILSTREAEEVETVVKATAICLEYPKYFNSILPEDLAMVLQLELTETQAMLDELASLFDVTAKTIRPFHASFSDYLYDPLRSCDFCCDRGGIVAEITYAHLRCGRDPDRLSFHSFARLLDEGLPTEGIQSILDQMDPSSIFSGDPFNGEDNIDAYYLIPILQLLKDYTSPEVHKNLILYFDQQFASHLRGLFLNPWWQDGQQSDSSLPSLSSVSNSSGEYLDSDDASDEHSDTDLPKVHAKGLLRQQTGGGNISDEDDHNLEGGAGSRPVHSEAEGGGDKDGHNFIDSVDSQPTYSAHKLVLLCASPAWDKVATGLKIAPSSLASFKSICDAAPFVRLHLHKTLSVLRDDTKQVSAAVFCLDRLTTRSTNDNLMIVFAELLPHSLSYAAKSPRVTRRINTLFRLRFTESYKHIPSGIWRSMSEYMSRYEGNIPDSLQALGNRQQPPSTSQRS